MNAQNRRPSRATACVTVLAGLLACAFVLCACSAPTPSGSADSPGASRAASSAIETVGAEGVYTVALDYNAGTGFEWQCSVEPEGVFYIVGQTTQDAYEQDPNDPITGGPLVDYVTVRATGPGTAALTCELVRPWEDGEAAEVQTFVFTVDDALGMEFVEEDSNFTNYPEAGSNS